MVPAHTEHSGPTHAAGDFIRIQRDVARGDAVVRDDSRAVITVSGPDRLVWLNSLITQDILGLTPGETLESLLLSPQGRIDHAFFLSDDGSTTWLLTARNRREDLDSWLNTMVFRMDVTVTCPEKLAVLASPHASLLSDIDAVVRMRDPWPAVGEGSVGYAEGIHPGADWALEFAVVSEDVLSSVPVPVVSSDHLDALSIAAARPTMADVDEKSLPHELDWLRTAVHLNKGCYRGQETVAKVHNLGHPPRRFTLLHLDGSESLLPSSGDAVMLGEKNVGHITRAAWHYELGPIALALIKRTAPVDEPLSVLTGGRSVGAQQDVIVPPDAGATRDIPRWGRRP